MSLNIWRRNGFLWYIRRKVLLEAPVQMELLNCKGAYISTRRKIQMFKALDQGVGRFTVKSKPQGQIIQRKVTAENFLKLSRIFSL